MENLLWIKTKLDSTFGMIMVAHLHKKNDSLLHEKQSAHAHSWFVEFCTVDFLQVWECLDPALRAFFHRPRVGEVQLSGLCVSGKWDLYVC